MTNCELSMLSFGVFVGFTIGSSMALRWAARNIQNFAIYLYERSWIWLSVPAVATVLAITVYAGVKKTVVIADCPKETKTVACL